MIAPFIRTWPANAKEYPEMDDQRYRRFNEDALALDMDKITSASAYADLLGNYFEGQISRKQFCKDDPCRRGRIESMYPVFRKLALGMIELERGDPLPISLWLNIERIQRRKLAEIILNAVRVRPEFSDPAGALSKLSEMGSL